MNSLLCYARNFNNTSSSFFNLLIVIIFEVKEEMQPTGKAIDLDMELKYFLADSNGAIKYLIGTYSYSWGDTLLWVVGVISSFDGDSTNQESPTKVTKGN